MRRTFVTSSSMFLIISINNTKDNLTEVNIILDVENTSYYINRLPSFGTATNIDDYFVYTLVFTSDFVYRLYSSAIETILLY